MQLPGPGVMGPLRDHDEAVAVVRRARERGVDHICVQNQYGLLDRGGEDMLEITRKRDMVFVPYFPLGSAFGAAPRPTEHPEVQRIAGELEATAAQVALAWLLHHAEHVLLIPGTSSLAHLEENLGAGELRLGEEHMTLVDGLADVRGR